MAEYLIKVKNCTPEYGWYKKQIGSEFEVEKYSNTQFIVKTKSQIILLIMMIDVNIIYTKLNNNYIYS